MSMIQICGESVFVSGCLSVNHTCLYVCVFVSLCICPMFLSAVSFFWGFVCFDVCLNVSVSVSLCLSNWQTGKLSNYQANCPSNGLTKSFCQMLRDGKLWENGVVTCHGPKFHMFHPTCDKLHGVCVWRNSV
jgi:hypothetical protein